MSAAESLNDFIAEAHAPFDDTGSNEPAIHWVVDDPARAEWALRRLQKIRRQMAENQQVADEEKRIITAWLDDVNGTLDRSARFFESLLTSWHERVLYEEPERKTISLPCGDLKARKQPDRWDFADEFVEWAASHRPDLVRVRRDVDKTAAKRLLEAVTGECVVDVDSGEKVPGVTVEPGGVRFSVEVRVND